MAGKEKVFAVRDSHSNARALFFIHGFKGDAWTTYGMLPAFIAGDPALAQWDIHCIGYPSGLLPDVSGVWSADPDLTSLAGYLCTLLRTRHSRYERVALVAHSMGGLIVQRAILDGEFTDRLDLVALFGTPSAGLRKAGFGAFFKRQAQDMVRDGPFVTRLRDDWGRRFAAGTRFRLRVVAGLRDEFVPRESSIAPFDPGCHDFIPGDHLQMVKPGEANEGAAALLRYLLAEKGAAGAATAPADRWTAEVLKHAGHEEGLSTEALVKYVLALEMTGKQDEAVRLLEARYAGDAELTGVLAGRYKRQWLADPETQAGAGARSLALYEEGFGTAREQGDDKGAFYNGINVAFLELALNGSRYDARVAAVLSLEHARRAPRDMWRLATEGEAALYLGEPEHAVDAYGEALREGPDERERESMIKQGLQACRLLGVPDTEARLRTLFGVRAPE